ncbi:hypothetical protein [Nonomuraea sp. NPDC005650]|uniref:hypothetical protein n=1 Tax=Nonomuraea sp. NPDC005650 TaxID=3157045 RepID=UPI0033BD64B6
MTPEEVRAYYDDDPSNTHAMCSMLETAHPGRKVWRAAGVWHARYATWPESRRISDSNAGLLSLTIRLGGVLL